MNTGNFDQIYQKYRDIKEKRKTKIKIKIESVEKLINFLDSEVKKMVNRKKRLKKGIESLAEQIEIHKEKKKQALDAGKLELANDYKAEIEGLEKTLNKKAEKMNKA